MPSVFDIAQGSVFDQAEQSVFDLATQPTVPQYQIGTDIEPLPEADVSAFGPRAAGALIGGAVTFAPSGLAGYAKLLTSGPEEAVKTIEEIQGFFPKHLLPEKHEQEAFEKTPPMWALGKVQEYKTRIGDYTMGKTGSPEAGALAATIFEAGVFLGLPWLTKRVGSAVKTKRANNVFALQKDARVKKALADYEASKKGMPLLEPDTTPAKSKLPGKPDVQIQDRGAPIIPPEYGEVAPKPLRPDQQALLGRERRVPETGTPLLKPDTTPVKSARVPTVEERLGKRPVYEGKSDPHKVLPEKPKETVFDVAEKPKAKEPVAPEIKPKPTPEEVLGKSEIAQRAKEQYKGWKGVEKSKVEIKTKGKTKEVGVDIPKKQADSLTPKEQKAYLVAEIDAAINKELKASGFGGTLEEAAAMPFNTLGESEGWYTFEVPGDGEFSVVGTKLFEFKKNVNSLFPATKPKPYKLKKFGKAKPKARPKAEQNIYEGDILRRAKPEGLKVADVDTYLKRAKKRDVYEGFINYLLEHDLNPEVTKKIRRSFLEKDFEFELKKDELIEKKGMLSDYEKDLDKAKKEFKKIDSLRKKIDNKKTTLKAAGVKSEKALGAEWQQKESTYLYQNAELSDLKREIKTLTSEVSGENKKGTTLSMLGTQGVYEGVAKEIPKLKEYAQKAYNIIDVESRFGEAKETGFHAKNFFSKWAAWEERTLDKIAETAKTANYDKNLSGVDTVLALESKTALSKASPEVKAVGQEVLNFQDAIKAEYAKRGVTLNFKDRIVGEIKDLIKNAETSEIPELEKALAVAEDMNFAHIPTAMWLESKLGSPTAGKTLKVLATQKRKSLNIKSLIDRGLIKPEDVNVFDIMASYGRRAGRDFALLDLRDAAVKEGLISKKETATNFVKIPAYESPIFAGQHLHPVLADYVRGELLGKGLNLGKVGKVFALSKLSAFINPLILPMYDTAQHGMLAMVNKWSRQAPKSNIPGYHLARGAKHFLKRTPEYYEALDNGLASKPYNNPFGSYENLTNWAKKSKKEKVLSTLESVLPHKVIQSAYRASWETAWQLDQMVRMGSYDLLKKKGFSTRDAAQIAAKAHSDYASVPASTRRALNIPFFTPTFKLTMGKFYGRMGLDAVRTAKDLPLGKLDPKTAIYAKALLGTVMANETYDLFMTKFMGMKRDEFGRRYTKEIDTDQGKKELTVTMSSPINMWQKYVFRAIASTSPEVDKPMVRFFEQNKWEIQPLFRVAYEIATNDNGRGDKVVSEFDSPAAKQIKRLRYATKSIVRLIGLIDRDPSDKEGIERFQKEYGKLTEIIARPFTFIYTRSPEDKRLGWKVRTIQNRFNKALRRGEIKPQHIDEYVKQLDMLLGGSK